MSRDLLPVAVRSEVASAASAYTLGEIRTLFATEGFREPDGLELADGAMRKSLVAGILQTIDFAAMADAQRFLRVVERLLEILEDTSKRTTHSWASETRTKILRELARTGITPGDKGRLLLPRRITAGGSLAAAPDETGIRLAMQALEREGMQPEERVGAAKELVEATIKFCLEELKEPYTSGDDIGALARTLHTRLRLSPSGVAPTSKGAETIVRILGGLTNIPIGLAELRNEGYGTGHGHSRRISGIKERHAELAGGAAVTYSTFMLDTVNDPEAPWRSGA